MANCIFLLLSLGFMLLETYSNRKVTRRPTFSTIIGSSEIALSGKMDAHASDWGIGVWIDE